MSDHGWKHDDLAADLAQHLLSDKRMVWTDMQLGPSGSARPDVYTLERSYSRPLPTAYECKISRSDLRSDTTSGKWQKYLQFAGAVIFAVPEGLCTPAELPTGCGLIVRKDKVWRHIRKATRQPVTLPMDACMKLLIDGVSRSVQRTIPQPREIKLWTEHEAVRKKFGSAVAKAARDLTAAQTEVTNYEDQRRAMWQRIDIETSARRKSLIDQAMRDAGEYEQAKRDLMEWLGLEEPESVYGIRRRIAELQAECRADARVEKVESALSNALRSAQQAARTLEAIAQEKAE
ncbi:MmcB family DNA repair protein [Novosphingobium sp. PY1]|uniref:MmcB family DNA repair protein n=1 Tax=Ochrobactrum sp. PW1 TaxID=1882222 RepID=A0A292GND9_9HYPH|nr:MmcB family DNA repair protein [Novosphingobium sp. PY1]BBA74378.1 hypothetical protein [Ochrobactrum sp. PW1]GFM29227.1 uncharacterized protein PY1_contig-07-153 [Novosphingobium sp. PY1]